MKKILLTTSLILAVSTNFAQNDKSKKIESKYLSLPSYDISTIDPATISIEFAMKDGVYGTEKLKDYQSVCKPVGGTVKDAVKVTTYYYEIPYTKQESYTIAKSADGQVVYAAKSSETKQDIIKFGYDKCEYWVTEKLKKDYASEGNSFKNSAHQKYESEVYTVALEIAKANVYLSYIEEEFEIYSAKGKAYDYADLDKAQLTAISAYESIRKNGLSQADIDKLKSAIAVWEKELEKKDTETKNARISSDIAKGLHENCIRAYFYIMDYDNALSHGKEFINLFGNLSTNRTNLVKELMLRTELQRNAAEKNATIVGDLAALNARANASEKSVSAKRLSSSDFDRLYSDFLKNKMAQASEVKEDRMTEENEAIADGTLNPYKKYVTPSIGGPAILMTMAPGPLSGFPELTELPKEMCELNELTSITILNNKIESISPDIANLTALKKLDLSGNNIKTLPVEIGELANLETLKLSNNPLESIPEEIKNCKNLKSLVIKNTSLSAKQIADLQKLLPNCSIKN